MIENHVLHATAWGLLHVMSPRRALAWTARVATLVAPLEDDEARRVSVAIGQRGTCLSRALTVAARLPDAEVVIGVESDAQRLRAGGFSAHAWVERSGHPLFANEVIPGEIVRMSIRRKTSKKKAPSVHLKSGGRAAVSDGIEVDRHDLAP